MNAPKPKMALPSKSLAIVSLSGLRPNEHSSRHAHSLQLRKSLAGRRAAVHNPAKGQPPTRGTCGRDRYGEEYENRETSSLLHRAWPAALRIASHAKPDRFANVQSVSIHGRIEQSRPRPSGHSSVAGGYAICLRVEQLKPHWGTLRRAG